MTLYKIAIVGGGANGVSVFNELVNQLTETSNPEMFEITLCEKSGRFGAGLAYGTNIDAHILNMHANTMSAVGYQPDHFLNWLKQSHDAALNPYFNAQARAEDFVPRKIFGIYLEEIYRVAHQKAEKSGIKIKIINEEAVDVVENHVGVFLFSGHKTEKYDQVLLCLGNHEPSFGRGLKEIPGYFHHAWPEKLIMDGIPNEADVYIIGSSLTSIDAFITLQEKGHLGNIKFISRHGLLPKVRTVAKPHKLVHLNPENILVLTKHGEKKLTLDEMGDLFLQEFRDADAEITSFEEVHCVLSADVKRTLYKDIDRARTGNLNYFSVLKAVDEVIGHLWNALSIEDRMRFDTHYISLWKVYDYPMPMQNAHKIINAMESGQLTVTSGFRDIEYDHYRKVFKITCADKCPGDGQQVFEALYVINATGQGLEITSLKSTLIRNALARGTISPHLLGGVDVDYETSAVRNLHGSFSKHLYVIGSLTRGVHFYTNSINENAKCGVRVVKAVMEHVREFLKFGKEKHMIKDRELKNIALFMGSDISTHLLMNELVDNLVKDGYQPFLYFPKHKPSRKAVLPELQTQGFFERIIPNEKIYPYLDSQPIQVEASCHSPKQIGDIYGIIVKEVEDINDPAFIEELRREEIDAGVVVRCYQKFGREIIQFFNEGQKKCLWNLHPGILPGYRGVMTFFRSMNEQQQQASYSLHTIDENWDAGPVIDIRPEPLDLSQAMLTNYCFIAPTGVPIILDNLNKLKNGEPIPSVPQDKEASRYHTFPTREEMDEFLKKGLRLVDPEYMREFYIANFSVEGSEHHKELTRIVDQAIYEKLGTSFSKDIASQIPADPSNS